MPIAVYYLVTLAPPGEDDWPVGVRRRCSLTLKLLWPLYTTVDAAALAMCRALIMPAFVSDSRCFVERWRRCAVLRCNDGTCSV